jgi:8-oxo-dGTP pyrophosphatase MutT (NUDIX family)
MRSFAGNWVFPGGREEPFDYDSVASAEDALETAARRAAVRETFEETGALLASSDGTAATDIAAIEQAVAALSGQPAEQFYAVLKQHKLRLPAERILPWAHWIAPLRLQHRFDTRFFIAALPAQGPLRADGGETLELAWWRPADAIAAVQRRELACAPPTLMNLLELQPYSADHGSVEALLNAVRDRQYITIQPRTLQEDGSRWALFPWDPGYANASPGGLESPVPERYLALPSRLEGTEH